jgi:DNA-directed RNA polymerase I, II, and III subunit RPABC3
MDEYDYVMYGLTYKAAPEEAKGRERHGGAPRVTVFISFGGLLLKLSGDPAKLAVLEVDSKVYLLLRRM